MIIKNLKYTILVLLFLVSCKSKKGEYSFITGNTQGTTYHITYENKDLKNYKVEIDSILSMFDKSMSIYDSTSIISQINRNKQGVKIDDWFIEVYNKSVEINKLSEGAFDITVGPICKAWGFGNSPKEKLDSATIDSLLQFVGMKNIRLQGNELIKSSPNVKVDVNALAQGFSVDLVCDFFEEEGVDNYLVEIGGELRAKGKNAKDLFWKVGIDRPEDGNVNQGENLEAVLELRDRALATSGNYRKFYIENGIKYSHIIDPKTGYTAHNNLLSVTVMAKKCIDADALATSFMVLGLEKSKSLLQSLPEIDVLFIYSNVNGEYEMFSTDNLKKMLVE